MNKITKDQPIPVFNTIEELRLKLHTDGCSRCSLGFQPEINGCCVSRGNPASRRIIIGEAPGKEEDAKGLPFTGPAGRLMDKIFSLVGFDTNRDFYVTNVNKCRPFLPKGSGKENFTPKVEQQKLCMPFLAQEIDIIKPKLIVLLGKVAVNNVLPEFKDSSMGELAGRVVRKNNIVYFIMYHTAAILHARSNPELEERLKEETWNNIQSLATLIEKEKL